VFTEIKGLSKHFILVVNARFFLFLFFAVSIFSIDAIRARTTLEPSAPAPAPVSKVSSADNSSSTETLAIKNSVDTATAQKTNPLGQCSGAAIQLMRDTVDHGVSSDFAATGENLLEANDGEGFQKHWEKFLFEIMGGDLRIKYRKKYPELVEDLDIAKIAQKTLLGDQCVVDSNLLPQHSSYNELKDEFIKYRGLAQKAKEEGDPSVSLTKNYKKGDKDPIFKQVRKYLQFYGFLENASDSEVYDDELFEVIKKFQEFHTIKNDGVISEKTRNAFKLTAQQRLDQIQLNLKRWRIFAPYQDQKRMIFVNIAGYVAEAFEGNERKLYSKVVVGRPTQKTPFFKAPMTQVIFNPSWNVPHSIASKEKLRKIQQDSGYVDRLVSSGFTFTDETGGAVNPHEINWHEYSDGYLPIHMRQMPGRGNALGQVKFDIKNGHTIYLHSTNQPKFFDNISRSESHGCIRVQSFLSMAEFAIGDYKTPDDIKKYIDSNVTQAMPVKLPITVYFVYITTWVDDKGNLRFSDDPYKLDDGEIGGLAVQQTPPLKA